ncbi:exosome complex protein Rrp42 [Candidatus Woesearchaeota archaeon]|nr:exosome complex protein Rrp42 [Candidatus Woesearchaeota archaeon]
MNKEQKKHIIQSLKQGVRLDGRDLEEYREVIIETGISATAEGSARVKLGETEVIAGVKIGIDKPFPDRPDDGILMVNAEFLPLSSPDFESGPPGIESIELARVVDRGIRESKMIDLKKLCIKPGEKVWGVMIDICTVNVDGNLLDAAGLAAMAAVRDAKFPSYENDQVDYKKMTEKGLPYSKLPIPVTIFKVGNVFLVDPTEEEEDLYDARLTVTTEESGQLCALQKGGEGPLSADDVKKMLEMGALKGAELREKLG